MSRENLILLVIIVHGVLFGLMANSALQTM